MFWASHVTPSAPSYIRHDLPGHQFFFQSTQGHNNDQHFTKCVHKPILSRAGGFPPRTPPYAISMPNAPPWSTRPCFASTFAPICLNCIVSGHINMYMYPCPRLVTVHGQLSVLGTWITVTSCRLVIIGSLVLLLHYRHRVCEWASVK